MARRFSAPYQSEPVSGLATWSRNLALFSIIAVVVSILIVRFGFLEVKPALATFFGALALAGLSILLGLAAFAAIWQNGSRGMSRILLALLIDAAILAYPAYLGLKYRKLPAIHDITPIMRERITIGRDVRMLGLMQDWPLLCHRIIDHAAKYHGTQEVVTRSVEGPDPSHQLRRNPCPRPESVAAARARRHQARRPRRHHGLEHLAALEAWYGILGIGAIYHTVNPRLFPNRSPGSSIMREDRMMMVDLTFVPMLEKIAASLPSVERYIVLTDKAHMPQTTLKNAVAYEDWIAEADGEFAWKNFDENTAAGMCYTSGTTGDPKGVLYSHRSNVLHAMLRQSRMRWARRAADIMLPVVPLFHANCWGIAFSAPSMGAKLVMPGPKLDGASVYELLDTEKVTYTAGVPTVWLMLLQPHGRRQPETAAPASMVVMRRLGDAARDDQDVPSTWASRSATPGA